VAGRGCLSPGECQDNYDSDADPEAVTHRRILIRYRRDPASLRLWQQPAVAGGPPPIDAPAAVRSNKRRKRR